MEKGIIPNHRVRIKTHTEERSFAYVGEYSLVEVTFEEVSTNLRDSECTVPWKSALANYCSENGHSGSTGGS